MKPTESWINDWKYGVDPVKEREFSIKLLSMFQQFWHSAELDQKSKTTRQRYSNALHALGGWAVEKAVEDNTSMDAHHFLVEATSGRDGPLIYLDREEWQKELDIVCRKLYKFLASQC